MPSITLRQLRDTRQIKTWLKDGQVIELREGNFLLGRIEPITEPSAATPLPDAAARRKLIFGDRVLSVVDDLIADRENSRN